MIFSSSLLKRTYTINITKGERFLTLCYGLKQELAIYKYIPVVQSADMLVKRDRLVKGWELIGPCRGPRPASQPTGLRSRSLPKVIRFICFPPEKHYLVTSFLGRIYFQLLQLSCNPI